MDYGIFDNQLTPVSGSVRAGIVTYDRNNEEHQKLLREGIPHFLGSLGAVHGETFPKEQLEAVIDVINAGDIEVDFFFAKFGPRSPVKFVGLATGAPTFGAEPDSNGNLKIFPIKHGEDLVVDEHFAKLFRNRTKCPQYPNGIGAGSFFMAEQIRRSINHRRANGKKRWIFAGRDNEYMAENLPIIGVMDKFGAIRGDKKSCAVLELNGLTPEMERRWGVDDKVITEDLPKYANGLGKNPNSFLTRWSSEDGKQQIVVIFTKLASTFDGRPVVWTKVKSNGNLPDNEMLKEVMTSLLRAGCQEMSSPERKWGLLRKDWAKSLSNIFHGPVPQLHIHANMEPEIVDALLQMKVKYRKFGHHTMLSGIMRLRNILNSKSVIGHEIPSATEIQSISREKEIHKPYSHVVDEIQEDVKRIFADGKSVTKKHYKAVDELREIVRLVFSRKTHREPTPQ